MVNSLPVLLYKVQTPSKSTRAKHLTPSNFLEAYQLSFQSHLPSNSFANATLNVGIKPGTALFNTLSPALISKFLSIIEKIKFLYSGNAFANVLTILIAP